MHALNECDEEWGVQQTKKVLRVDAAADTTGAAGAAGAGRDWKTAAPACATRTKTLRDLIPAHMPYVVLEWDTAAAGHVVENTQNFTNDFGLDVIAGVLGLDPPR
jgi:hypothetical protein